MQFQDKGALVPAIGMTPMIVVAIVTYLLSKALGVKFPFEVYHILIGLSLLLSAVINFYVRPDNITDKEGGTYNFPASFMYLDMGVWTYIFAFIGVCVTLDGVVHLLDKVYPGLL